MKGQRLICGAQSGVTSNYGPGTYATWTTITEENEVFASSDPLQTGLTPDTWVAVGLGVGITKGPEQPGRYVLVAEPVDESFQRGDAWRVRSSLVPDGFVGFEVGGGVFLDEDWQPLGPSTYFITDSERIHIVLSSDEVSDETSVDVSTIQSGQTFDTVEVTLQAASLPRSARRRFIGTFITHSAQSSDPPLPGSEPIITTPILDFMFDASPAGAAKAESGSLGKAALQGGYILDFGELNSEPLGSARKTEASRRGSKSQPEPLRVLISNCPGKNPGCATLPLPTALQPVDANGDPENKLNVTVSLWFNEAWQIGLDPTDYEIWVALVDPMDSTTGQYHFEFLNDNFDRGRPPDPLYPPYGTQEITLRDVVTGEASQILDRIFHTHPFWEEIMYYAHPFENSENWALNFQVQGLSPYPGDNYQILAALVNRDKRRQRPISVPPPDTRLHLTRQFELWDRLFIEDDPTYQRGAVLVSDATTGSSSLEIIAADFDVQSEVRNELQCFLYDGVCCKEMQSGSCVRPEITVFSSTNQQGESAFLGDVTFCDLSSQNRSARYCTIELVDSSGDAYSLTATYLFDDVSAISAGVATVAMEQSARSVISDNFEPLFYDVHFMSDTPGSGSSPLPKLPLYWASANDNPPMGELWHEERWVRFFDNNIVTGQQQFGDIRNFIHYVDAWDYQTPSYPPPKEPELGGYSRHEKNFSCTFKAAFWDDPDIPSYWKAGVWNHEIVHQFAINYCDPDDHCGGNTSIVPNDEGWSCVMKPEDPGPNPIFHGPYVCWSCAIPRDNTYGRTVCPDQNGEGMHIRTINWLNLLP